jgi:hypothetical protein
MRINKFNSEGYYDPTPYEALTNIIKDEKELYPPSAAPALSAIYG